MITMIVCLLFSSLWWEKNGRWKTYHDGAAGNTVPVLFGGKQGFNKAQGHLWGSTLRTDLRFYSQKKIKERRNLKVG